MQFNRDAAGIMTPLPKPVDRYRHGPRARGRDPAGQAFELRQRSHPAPSSTTPANLFGVEYGNDPKIDTALRINADHARATAFLIHDGVLPSNEGRGYVLRKIMRRAMRNARLIGQEEPYLYELTGFVAELMRPAYPEMMESVQRVARVVKDEEHRYATTFLVAEKVFQRRSQEPVRRRSPGRGLLQALRHLRTGARRAGRDGARARPQHRSRRLRSARCARSASAPAPVGKAARRAPSPRLIRNCVQKGRTKFLGYDKLCATSRVVGPAGESATGRQHRPEYGSGTRPRSDAVLRGNRRPGRRSRIAAIGRDWRAGGDGGVRLSGGARTHRASHQVARGHPRGR